jgi:hypothetical protein
MVCLGATANIFIVKILKLKTLKKSDIQQIRDLAFRIIKC